MVPDALLFHYGEIATKSGNRLFFERQLARNIANVLAGQVEEVNILRGRILAKLRSGADLDEVRRLVKFVFGLEYVLVAKTVAPKKEDIIAAAVDLMRASPAGTWKADTLRSDKNFPLNSMEMSAAVGEAVINDSGRKVDVKNPDIVCRIEILPTRAFVAAGEIRGSGGLPTGTQAPVVALLSGGIDSPVAVTQFQKRGAPVLGLHFHSYPQTSRASLDKVKDLGQILALAQNEFTIFMVPFIEIQKAVVKSAPPELRVILYRRSMFRIAQKIAQTFGILALGTGESLGQVASQTIENIAAVNDAVTLPVLRPLLGANKDEIIALAKKFGTLEISNRPHEDCCSLFSPEHPETRAKIANVRLAESAIEGLAELEDAAIRGLDKTVITC
jgi:tRNA uracil 4-sulfurtransferase